MRKLSILVAAVSALAAATPTVAQNWSNSSYRGDVSLATRISQLDARLQAGIRSGDINRYEARSLREQLRELRTLHARYSYNGFSRYERDDLQDRIRNARRDIRLADNGRFDRDSRYGAWDDRYWSDSRYLGQGGPLEEIQCNRRGGRGGVIDDALGRSTCLGIGDRATSNLYAVPYDHRAQFSDNSRSYFRSDGTLIYEIDRRDNRVTRIYGMD